MKIQFSELTPGWTTQNYEIRQQLAALPRVQMHTVLVDFIRSIPESAWKWERDDFTYGYRSIGRPRDAGIRVTMATRPVIVKVVALDAWDRGRSEFQTVDVTVLAVQLTAKFIGLVLGNCGVHAVPGGRSIEQVERTAQMLLKKHPNLVPKPILEAAKDLKTRLESKELRKTWQERLTQELEAASFAVNKAKDDSNEVTNV